MSDPPVPACRHDQSVWFASGTNESLSAAQANESYPEERPEDMDPSEPDGITSPPDTSSPPDPNKPPAGAVTKSRLQNLEQNLLTLERNYGATHPQV